MKTGVAGAPQERTVSVRTVDEIDCTRLADRVSCFVYCFAVAEDSAAQSTSKRGHS